MSFQKAAAVALILPFLCLLTHAQQPAGELRLEVKDATGAAIAQVSGSLENLATGSRRRFTTNAQGQAVVPALPFGRYRLDAARPGFATHSSTFVLDSPTIITRRIVLTVGASAYAVEVVSSTPLPGADRAVSEIAAPVQVATARDLEASGALELSDFLNRRLNGLFLNELQGNPVQPDLNYRGYTASPLLGTPQGLSLYLDGVRLNEPFGDVVSWDLIPRIAIAEVALIPGSNPLFGLNTLGGALSLRTKDGRGQPGTSLQLSGGSFGRKVAELEHGGSRQSFDWYLASQLFFEDGWRQTSPSNVRQFFARLGWQRERTTVGLSLAYANNSLIGNGLQEQRLLARDYTSVYTKPDVTAHRAPFVNLQLRHSLSSRLTLSGNTYFRYIRTRTLNGDLNEASLDQAVYQPGAAERAALAAAGYTGFPAAGATAANTPFPFWRCLGNALLRDEPGEKCNGLLNRGGTQQRNHGLSGQLSWRANGHQLTAGAAYDGNSVGFTQSTELGYLNPDRSVTGVGAFGDGVTGGEVDGEPYDTRVNLNGRIQSGSLFATDTITIGRAWNVTLSGRYNRTSIDNRDRIRPQAGLGSLTGRHVFHRFNPAAGVTFQAASAVQLYAGYTEGNRAPTSVELGCADPQTPCKLPNAMAGDPPLEQVTTRTLEAGVRGGAESNFRWSAGWFRADNRSDILFVASEQTGFGYFKNFGQTRRQGLELDLRQRVGRATVGGGYTFLDATFQSPEEVNGSGNSTNEQARRGVRGLESSIQIDPGRRIPLAPRQLLKAFSDVQLTKKLLVDAGLVGISGSYARGNENNQHQADGTYYLGPGRTPAYAVVNLGGRYQLYPRLQIFVQANNLFDRRYYSGAQLGPTGLTSAGQFIARPFAAVGTEYPIQQATFFAPGAPRGVWGGLRVQF